jgi:hypothetical protein
LLLRNDLILRINGCVEPLMTCFCVCVPHSKQRRIMNRRRDWRPRAVRTKQSLPPLERKRLQDTRYDNRL